MIYKLCFHSDIVVNLTAEENQKRIFVFSAALISIPVCVAFGLMHLAEGRGVISSLSDFLTAGIILFFSILLRNKWGEKIIRILIFAVSIQFLFYIGSGLFGGGEFFWLYTYPLIAIFLFGFWEGFAWIIFFFTIVFCMVFGSDLTTISDFGIVYKLKFAISIVLTSFMAALFELLRDHYYQKLQEQKHELEKAVKKIKTLSGMLPICSSCKKIRDDKGYWKLFESYIENHSDVSFSHSICPSCTKKLYGNESWYSSLGEE